MRHEDYKELLALEAAGALDAEEARALGAHLPSCRECRAELDALHDAAAGLAYAVAPVAPPARLRESLLEQVRALGPRRAPAAEAAPPAVEATQAAEPLADRARDFVSRLGFWQLLAARPSFALGAALAVGLVFALSVVSYALWSRNAELRAEVARAGAEAARSREELERERAELARAREMGEMLASPGAGMARLAGKGPAPGASAVVAFDPSTGRAVLITSGLPPAPAGKAYQLWFIAGGKPLPGRVFKTDEAGRGRLDDRMPPGMPAAPTFAVTLERESGAPAPEGAIYLAGSAS
ncbi:MAG TPA: anti-sigma factor [Pyrinomonadaceae bacterium]|nr:anti-sigma factor [Pyrinomonadaceae bacterium]